MQWPSSRSAPRRFRTFFWFAVSVSTLLILSIAQGDTTDARYKSLGHRLICKCDSEPATGMGERGCKQILLECTHTDCEPSKNMRRELTEALQMGESDDAILHSFVKNYGADVLEQSGIVANKLILILALVALTSITITFIFVRKQKPRPASSAMSVSELEDADFFRDRVQRVTERDDL